MNHLQKQSLLLPERLSGTAYTESLLEEGERVGLISTAQADGIRYQCMELLAERLQALYGKHTDSVPDEWASQVFDGMLYTVSAWLKTFPTPESALEALRTLPMDFLYQKGLRTLTLLMRDLRTTAMELYASLLLCPNPFYKSAIAKELPTFVKSCQLQKNPEEHGGYLFYSPAILPRDVRGVEYVRAYAHALLWENRFCGLFPAEDLREVWNTPDAKVGNVFLPVLETVSANLLLHGVPSCKPLAREALQALPREEGALLPRLQAAFGNANPYLRACLPTVAKGLAMRQ